MSSNKLSATSSSSNTDVDVDIDNASAFKDSYCETFGGWENFMMNYGLKPWDDDDVEEGERILEAFREADEYEQQGALEDVARPDLEAKQADICASFGGWENFMLSYGLMPWDENDVEEGERVLEAFREADEYGQAEDEQVLRWEMRKAEICASYGGWENFMISYGLKPWDDDDVEEAERILEAFREEEE